MERKKQKTISKNAIFMVLASLVMVLIVAVCIMSPIFMLKEVRVSDARIITQEEIMRIADIHMGDNLFRLQTDNIKNTLMKDLRIDNAVVQRVFPNQLDINIEERIPLAIIECEYGYVEVGKGGVVLAAHRTLKNMPVPIISGVKEGDIFIGDLVTNPQALKVIEFLGALDDITLRNLSEINIADMDNVVIYATGAVQIKIGPLDALKDKVVVTKSVIGEINKAEYPIEYIDARFDVYSIKLKV